MPTMTKYPPGPTDNVHTLDLDGLRIASADQPVMTSPSGTSRGWRITTRGENLDRGTPAPIDKVLESALRDGDLTRTDRYGNREMSYVVQLEAFDGQGLAEAEAELTRRLGRKVLLRWQPMNAFAKPTIFEVETSSMTFMVDDFLEAEHLIRRFRLRLVAQPFARSVNPVTVAALPVVVDPTTTLVDAGNSTAGWSLYDPNYDSTNTSDVSSSGGIISAPVYAPGFVGGAGYLKGTRLRRTASLPYDSTSTPYLAVELKVTAPSGVSVAPVVLVDDAELALLASAPGATSGFTRYTYQCIDTAVNRIDIALSTSAPGYNGSTVSVDKIERTNVAPGRSGTGRETLRSLHVAGSVRTPVSLALAADSGALGQALVYTGPGLSGFTPSLRAYATSGTADNATVSGSVNAGTFQALVPSAAMPRGGYVVWASLRPPDGTNSVTGQRVVMTARSSYGVNEFGTTTTIEGYVDLVDAYQFFPIGSLVLPPTDSPLGAPTSVKITLTTPGAPTTRIDNVYLFHAGENTALTMVDCGTTDPVSGGASSRLWLDEPTPDLPRRAVWVGTQPDRADGRNPGTAVRPWGAHVFDPTLTGIQDIFVATTKSTMTSLSGSYYPRWHDHAAL